MIKLKSILFASFIIGSAVFTTSCSKKYKCDCAFVYVSSSLNGTHKEEIKAKDEATAQSECDNIKNTLAQDTDKTSIGCTLTLQ